MDVNHPQLQNSSSCSDSYHLCCPLPQDASVHSAPKTNVGTIAYMAPEVTEVNKSGAPPSYAGPPVDM